MTFAQKKELIDSLIVLSVNDILTLSSILSSSNLQPDSFLEGKELLESLASILFDCYTSEIDEDKKITFYYYYHKIESELKSISEDEQEAENEEEEDSIYNAKDRKEIEIQKDFVDRVTNMSIKELTNEMLDFIKSENHNLLYQGFDRNIINKLMILYREKNLILNWILLPDAIYKKTERATDNAKEEIKKEVNGYQKNNLKLYADNFEKWLLQNQISKKTKQNFKSFLKANDIKIDEFLTIQIINYKNDFN